MRCQSGLRPVRENAAGGAGDELLRTFADEADDLRAHGGIEALAGENARDLFAESAIALESLLHVLADGDGEALLQARAILRAAGVGQGLLQRALDGAANAVGAGR